MKIIEIQSKDNRGSFKYRVPVSAIKELITPVLLEELKKFYFKSAIREDHIENKEYLKILINAGLVCGFYFRSYDCCYGLTELGYSVLSDPK